MRHAFHSLPSKHPAQRHQNISKGFLDMSPFDIVYVEFSQ